MKIACAYDADLLDYFARESLEDPDPERQFSGRRFPYALHLRHRETGWEFTLVGVHFKSGFPAGGDPEDDPRSLEVKHLAGWLAAQPGTGAGHFGAPPTPDVLVMGDFNLVAENKILLPLRTKLGAWHWSDPVVVTSLADGEPGPPLEDPDERWSTFLMGPGDCEESVSHLRSPPAKAVPGSGLD